MFILLLRGQTPHPAGSVYTGSVLTTAWRVKLCVCVFKALGLSTISLLQNKKNTTHDSCLSPLFLLTDVSNHHLV